MIVIDRLINQTKTLFVKEMEQHFYRDDFEQMLKDTTEDFRMYPSRKIWHSIYNDLHPDRKWPSFAVCLLLLSSILYIGVSNNNNISSRNARMMLAQQNNSNNKASRPSSVSIANTPGNTIAGAKSYIVSDYDKDLYGNAVLTRGQFNTLTPVALSPNTNNGVELKLRDLIQAPMVSFASYIGSRGSMETSITAIQRDGNANTSSSLNPTVASNEPAALKPAKDSDWPTSPTSLLASTVTKQATKDFSTLSWMENFAFHNVRNKTKWKTNTSFQYYVAPSLGYRTLEKNNDFEPLTGALLRTNDNEAVTHQAAPGFEAGAQILVGLSKKLRFKAGLQYNYTKYITYAHELQHPSQATVLMNDMNNRFVIPVSYNSYHANVLGSNFNRLSNRTNQLSLPLGFDYKLAGNNKIRWYVGSSIQPSLLVSGNAVLISHDSKHFVNDASVLRKFNVNSSLETFVSFKTPSGIDINVGPQVRYQLLSSYNKEYTYTERLYNLGLKIGITKKL